MYFSHRLFAITKGVRLRILLAAALGLVAAGAGIARLAISGVAIARVFQGEPLSGLVVPLVVVAGMVLLRGVFQYLRDAVGHQTADAVKIKVRSRLYEHCLALGPGHFDQRRTGDVLATLVEGVESLETYFGQYLPQLLVAAVAPLLIFGFMAALDLQIGAIFLASAILVFALPAMVHRWNRSRNIARRDAYGTLWAEFLDSFQGLTTLKAFGQSKRKGDLLAARARQLYRRTMGVLLADGAAGAITMLGISAGAALALASGAIRLGTGELELATLMIVLMLGAEVFRPLRELTQLYHQGMVAMSSAEGVFALLDTPVTVQAPKQHTTGADGGAEDPSQAHEITFEGVTFGYEGGRRPALHDLSFRLGAGETLGLVGPSGAGKSTVVWLMLRFYDPQQGRVLLDSRELRELPLEDVRRHIAVVTQDTYLFDGTVAENLLLGRPEATREELEDAAGAANAHEFIAALPLGYDTPIGERGVRLSTGERQRIAIARALLKSAPILVLDEALSSVDAKNEAAIQQALDRLMEGRTALIIAHRLSSVVDADRILVLDSGRLVESGRHEGLSASNGAYARLMASQQVSPEQDLIAATLPAGEVDSHRHSAPGARTDSETDGGRQAVKPLPALVTWARLLGLALRWWGKLALSMVFGLAHHGSVIGLGAVAALLVGQVFTGGETAPLFIALALVVPLTALFMWGESWFSHDLAFRLLAEMRVEIYDKLEPLAPAYLVRRRSGDLTSVVGGDIDTIEYFFAHWVTPTVVAVVMPGAVLVTLAILAWPLALVLAPFLAVVAAAPFVAQTSSERLGGELRERLGDLNAYLVDGIQGMREIAAFGRGAARVRETSNKGVDLGRHRVRFLKAQSSQAAFIEGATALGGLAVLALGAWLVVEGQIARTQLPLVTLLALSSFIPISDVSRTLKQLVETLAASRRVFAVHDEPVDVRDGPGVGDGGGRIFRDAPSISFEHVEFSYGRDLPPALDDVTFKVEPGQTVALVGRSGAGKTTSAHLLMRFWDPGAGGIALDDHVLRDFRLEELRQQIAFVSQDTHLFNLSIRENLRMGRHGATDAEIEEAARVANAGEFIEAMPDDYDTLVGERGMRLSGGQRQRISIARAVLKDAPVLILDEATSHLDAVNEQQVRQALQRLMKGRTTLVIAHRLSTVRDADRIVVLDFGQVAEEGTHRELLAAGGLYAQLVAKQLVGTASQAPAIPGD